MRPLVLSRRFNVRIPMREDVTLAAGRVLPSLE